MAKFLVQLISVFSPADVTGSTEDLPDDVPGPDTPLVTLAAWPRQPLEVEADDEEEAERLARADWQRQGASVHLDVSISRERYAELLRRPRPGSVAGTSVWTTWDVRQSDDG
jgi:hypothetical protein